MSLVERPTQPLLAGLADDDPPPLLPPLSAAEEVIHDYQTQGLSLRGHPFSPLRAYLDSQKVLPTAALQTAKPNRQYRVAGLVLMRQRPSTAKGITFMTIEDETGSANLIVRLSVWERYRRVGRLARAIIATGLLQRQESVIHLIVSRLQDLTEQLPSIGHQSRDFH